MWAEKESAEPISHNKLMPALIAQLLPGYISDVTLCIELLQHSENGS